jgi:hypothetical protein
MAPNGFGATKKNGQQCSQNEYFGTSSATFFRIREKAAPHYMLVGCRLEGSFTKGCQWDLIILGRDIRMSEINAGTIADYERWLRLQSDPHTTLTYLREIDEPSLRAANMDLLKSFSLE